MDKSFWGAIIAPFICTSFALENRKTNKLQLQARILLQKLVFFFCLIASKAMVSSRSPSPWSPLHFLVFPGRLSHRSHFDALILWADGRVCWSCWNPSVDVFPQDKRGQAVQDTMILQVNRRFPPLSPIPLYPSKNPPTFDHGEMTNVSPCVLSLFKNRTKLDLTRKYSRPTPAINHYSMGGFIAAEKHALLEFPSIIFSC